VLLLPAAQSLAERTKDAFSSLQPSFYEIIGILHNPAGKNNKIIGLFSPSRPTPQAMDLSPPIKSG
jgi:hypothetical protein